MKLKSTLLLSLLAQILLINISTGAELDYSSGILDNKKILSKSKSVNTIKYPNSNEVLIDEYTVCKYNPDGTAITWNDSALKILTEKGRKENRTVTFSFTLPYSTIKVKRLEILKPDGTVSKIDINQQSRIMIDNSQMYSNIYNPNDKLLKVSIPNLQLGDIVRFVTERKSTKTVIPNAWYDLSLFENIYPIEHAIYKVIAPNKLPLRKQAILDKYKESIIYKEKVDKNNMIYEWEARNIPRIFKEPSMPSLVSVMQRVLVSTISNWKEISVWYWNLCEPAINATNSAMKEKVTELTNNVKSDKEKIDNIYYFVAQQIRYMGLTTENEAPGFEPHDAKLTFNNRYGVCRDKAALLVSMLRLAGFKAYPVLIKVGAKLDKEVPLPYFNHAITCVEIENDKYIFMDPTDENSKQLLPSYLNNRSYLVAKPQGDTLKTTPISPAEKNLILINTKGTLDDKNNLTAVVNINFNGINDTAYRNYFARLNNDERKSFFEKILRNSIPSASLINYTLKPANILNTKVPIRLRLEYNASDILISGRDNALLEIPWLGRKMGVVNFIIGNTGLDKRKYPFVTEIACGYSENIDIIILDKNIKIISLPDYKNSNNNLTEYKQNIKVVKNKLIGSNKFLLKIVEFTPEEYLKLKQMLKEIEIDMKKMPILKLKTNELNNTNINNSVIDSVILNKNISITLKDKKNWMENYKIKKVIKSYNGKKDNSEIKIHYNPAWESVKIINASVTNKNNVTKNLNQSELNTMDASWNAGAPRYPEGKILVANLPGVEIGSTIEIEYQKQIKNKPFFSAIYNLRSTSPIDKYSITVTAPSSIKLNITKLYSEDVNESIIHKNSNNEYKWSVTNQAALKKEESTPPLWTFVPTIIISSGDFQKYIKLIQNTCTAKMNNSKNTSLKAELLTKNIEKAKDKILKIRDYISKNIKIAGPSFTGLPISSISSPDITLKDGYGNNLDIALVYYTMLKTIGFKPEFILASEYTDIKDIIKPILLSPQRTFFNYVLIRVKDKNNFIYLNDTDEYSPYGSTTHSNCVALKIPDGQLFTIKPLQDKEDKIVVDNKLELSDNGSLILTITKKYFGNYFALNNKKFAFMRPEEKERYYKEKISEISKSSIPVTKLFTDFTVYPGIEKYKINIADFSVINDNYYYFNDFTNLKNVLNLGLSKRFYPYYFNYQYNIIINNYIYLPSNMTKILISPKNKNILLPNKSGNIRISSRYDELKKHMKEEIKITSKPSIISPEGYQSLLKAKKDISSKSNNTYLLEINK
ncbi:MAG: DUF3857 domain-containing protein [bacterium]|nr:DUF3857 domain-containing protein [bacterium]